MNSALPQLSTIMSVYENSNQAFESTSTLVALPPPLSFVFSRSSVTNSTVYSSRRPVYKIKSTSSRSRTEIFDLDGQKTVASIKRRQFLPDVVVFAHRNNKAIKIDKWLSRRKVPHGQIRYVDRLHTLAGTFIWKSETLGSHRFALYVEGQDDIPIAYSRVVHHPKTIGLILKPGWDHVLVEILTSFLVLEHKYRMENKEGREMIYLALTGFSFTGR